MKKKKLSLGGLPDIGFMDQDAGSLPGAFGDKAAPRPAAVKLKKELAAKKVAKAEIPTEAKKTFDRVAKALEEFDSAVKKHAR